MRQFEAELTARGVRVFVITFEAAFLARHYVEDSGLSWPVLLDPDRRVYRHYRMDRAGWRELYSPRVLIRYARLLRRGRRAAATGGDTRQRGGDVLIGPSGEIALHAVGRGPADRVSIDRVMDLLRRAPGAAG